ncbi:eukaryotic and archaeal DNA primase, large subunit-domain-containing protein [Dunaliella salina]|uniref:DNA primase large subunit n=1 Tax=Dunaliella salina TaxID=3046 RepID=A0ABQ7G2M5_DUNSA|nr:eukaryotic and archaeal DNA primase, large subunit-domain-containing protein [Dunaliella salina]|eukprot:KAF5828854.1 eukaryotic and archaeal DNA primase, large subunit-domain-containing protein [Dunaliella salina]
MQFVSKTPRGPSFGSATPNTAKGGERINRHTLLTLYEERPQGDITLEEFESLALDRLRVLKGIEDVKLRNKSDAEIQAKAEKLLQDHLEGENNEETRRRDQLSHYILRLAYCRTPELRKWFLTQESELFRHRFSLLLTIDSDKREFLARSKLEYTPLEQQEKDLLLADIQKVMLSQAMKTAEVQQELNGTFYKVPFQAVPDLVAQRRVLLRRGYAYVSQRDLASLVVQAFRAKLSLGLAEINKQYGRMFPENDTRLKPLVAGLSTRYLGTTNYESAASRHGGVSLATLPGLAQRHFPLCMQTLMTQLRSEHHLRHTGRQQLSLFLKAIGLPLEDALIFWRQAFAPRIPPEKFDKEYAYNIRHNYGKEGARKDYSAHNCLSIIRMSGGATELHGCPYKRMDEASLRASLSRAGCDLSRMEEVVSKAKGGHFQLACACSFEGMHKGIPLDSGVNHPAEYYSESRRVWEEKLAPAEGGSAAKAQNQSSASGGAAQTPVQTPAPRART